MNAIVTLAIGSKAASIAKITHPTIKAYADKIGADFIVLDNMEVAKTVPHFEKFRIHWLLNKYNRIIYIDTDIIVRDDCPNLFDVVTESELGMFNEAPFNDRSSAIKEIIDKMGPVPSQPHYPYFNSGVMVISRVHKKLFTPPEVEIISFFEQSMINWRIWKNGIKVHHLDYRLNRMSCMDNKIGKHRLDSYIVHYAGSPPSMSIADLASKDIARWRSDAPHYSYKINIIIHVHGGLGDQICAEPIIRYISKIYPDENLNVKTWFPRLYRHLPVKVYDMAEFTPEFDTPYFVMDTMVPETHIAWLFMSPNLMNNTEFASLICLKKMLSDAEKVIKLEILDSDVKEVNDALGEIPENAVLVHAGRGWASKTFPESWWQAVVDGIKDGGGFPILIGKDINDDQGAIDIVANGGIDARNLLGLGAMMALIRKTKILVSNDSAPVHVGGAFDNWILLIPTCKHPDHVLPVRNGSRHYKAVSMYKKLTNDDVDNGPITVDTKRIDGVKGNILDYIPEPNDVAKKALEILNLEKAMQQLNLSK